MMPILSPVLRRTLALLVVAGACALAAPVAGADAPSLEAPFPTNLSLLSEAADAAIQELFLDFTPRPGASVLVESESKHEAQWFVQDLLLARLMDMGFHVHLRQAEPPPQVEAAGTPTVPPDTEAEGPAKRRRAKAGDTGADTGETSTDLAEAMAGTTTAPNTTAAAAEEAVDDAPDTTEAAPVPDTDYVFRFRVVECGVTYPKTYRTSPLGSRRVQRMALVNIHGTMVSGRRETVAWVGRGDAERADVVPSGKLPVLEGGSFPFSKPNLTTKGFGSYLEPALVTGIVVGLIYLFYTNQD